IRDFDFLGITIQYEMCYTNILQVLDLSQIPLLAKDRTEEHPIVIGGGPCTYNPEPIADFFDIFYIGEGETTYDALFDLYKDYKPLFFFGMFALIFMILGVIVGIPVIVEFIKYSFVYKIPSAILATGLVTISFLLMMLGLILDHNSNVEKREHELRINEWIYYENNHK
ncbi:MAG: hypothetical protein ACI4P1_04410, partial [Erysipelotrichaceae bacterium]